MKNFLFIVLAVIAIGMYSCQKDNSVQLKSTSGALLKGKKDTTPPDFKSFKRDTTPPDFKTTLRDTTPPDFK